MPRSPEFEDRIAAAFARELVGAPGMSLRGAAAVDIGQPRLPLDSTTDSPSDAYLEAHGCDLPFLDAASWRIYLPRLLALAIRLVHSHSNAVSGLLDSLRPPDREPPRLASLTSQQESVVRAVLEHLAFSDGSVHSEAACTALQEWWGEDPLFRALHV